jgi:hypothetical protein
MQDLHHFHVDFKSTNPEIPTFETCQEAPTRDQAVMLALVDLMAASVGGAISVGLSPQFGVEAMRSVIEDGDCLMLVECIS